MDDGQSCCDVEGSWTSSSEILSNPRELQLHVSVDESYNEKCVLVTGATGFLGKVLVEKLLRSCRGITELIILIRPSINGDAESRLETYRQNRIFDRLRNENPSALNKITAVSGDVTLDNLGLSDMSLHRVINGVNVVYHCAANVRFDGKARNILNVNLLGVQNILNLCKRCTKLEALVHVSTAYSFCNRQVISEEIYPERVKPENIIDILKWMTDEQLYDTCKFYAQDRPAFYHFSKALAEILLVESDHKVPVIIVRPSIVTASVKEPYAGWIDNYNGPSGFIHVCGKGIVKTLLVKEQVNADWVPVDIVANTLIVAAHYIAVTRKFRFSKKLEPFGRVPIVNCICPESNVITWMEVVNICLPFLRMYPPMETYGMPGGTVTPCPFKYNMCRLFYHYLPALLMDAISCLFLRKPRFISLYITIHRVMSHLEYYTTRPFTFSSPNMRILVEQMDIADRQLFPIDQSTLNWNEYIENYVLGVRGYFSGENDGTLPAARKRMFRTHYIWSTIKLASIVGVMISLQSLHKHGRLRISFVSLLAHRFSQRKM